MLNVLFIWEVPEPLKAHFEAQLNHEKIKLIFPQSTEEDDWMTYAQEADVVVGWRPTKEFLTKAKRLKLLVNPGAGVQHLKDRVPEACSFTIVNGHGNAFFTAEHALAMLLTISNQIVPHHNWMLEGKWRLGDDEAKSISLRHRKIALLGYGNVNRQVHELLKPFGCEILLLKRTSAEGIYGVGQLNEVMENADVAIIALPSTNDTKDLIGTKELEQLGANGILINLGRGNIVNEEALYDSLKNNKIMAAGIDVWYEYEVEPDAEGKKRPYNFPFHELDNVLFSPHRAASPFDNLERWDDAIYNIKACATGKEFVNVVDLALGY